MLAKSSNCRWTGALPKKSWYTFPCFEECTPVSCLLISIFPEGDVHRTLEIVKNHRNRVLLRSYPELQIACRVGCSTIFRSQVAEVAHGVSVVRAMQRLEQYVQSSWLSLIHFVEWFALKFGPHKFVFEMAPFVCLLAVLLRVGIVNRHGIQKGLNHLRLFTDVAIGCNVEIFPIIFMGTTFLNSSLILSSSRKSNFRNSSKAFSLW